MSVVDVVDKNGSASQLWKYNDMYLPMAVNGNPAHHLPALYNWKTKPDDVFVCSYPKSGTNWVWEIVCMLRQKEKEILANVFPNIEIWKLEALDSLPSPRTLQTHMKFRCLPKHFLENKGKIIYVTRNPKDVAVSMYKFMISLKDTYETYNGKWEDYLHRFYNGELGYGSWYDHVRDWENFRKDNDDYPILFVNYEDMHQNCEKEIIRMADFLGVSVDKKTVANIASQVQFKNFKSKKLEKCGPIFQSISKTGKDIFFRKGTVGDWRNNFTVSQNDEFDNVYKEKMNGSKLTFEYSLH